MGNLVPTDLPNKTNLTIYAYEYVDAKHCLQREKLQNLSDKEVYQAFQFTLNGRVSYLLIHKDTKKCLILTDEENSDGLFPKYISSDAIKLLHRLVYGDEPCFICNSYASTQMLPCNHQMCFRCLQRMTEPRCPMCKQTFSSPWPLLMHMHDLFRDNRIPHSITDLQNDVRRNYDDLSMYNQGHTDMILSGYGAAEMLSIAREVCFWTTQPPDPQYPPSIIQEHFYDRGNLQYVIHGIEYETRLVYQTATLNFAFFTFEDEIENFIASKVGGNDNLRWKLWDTLRWYAAVHCIRDFFRENPETEWKIWFLKQIEENAERLMAVVNFLDKPQVDVLLTSDEIQKKFEKHPTNNKAIHDEYMRLFYNKTASKSRWKCFKQAMRHVHTLPNEPEDVDDFFRNIFQSTLLTEIKTVLQREDSHVLQLVEYCLPNGIASMVFPLQKKMWWPYLRLWEYHWNSNGKARTIMNLFLPTRKRETDNFETIEKRQRTL